jgi:double-strand break repair protein MRE11
MSCTFLVVSNRHIRLFVICADSFTRGDLNLADMRGLDPDGVNVDKEVTEILDERVRVLIYDAREQIKENLQNAEEKGNILAGMEQLPLKYALQKPDLVLVRLSVDHSGFSVLNNQRFGAKFVGEVANPVRVQYDRRCQVLRSPVIRRC